MDFNKEIKMLALDLVNCETEKDVVATLIRHDFWNTDESFWRSYGDMEGNIAIIENQGSTSVKGIIEKLMNSIDSLLILEAHKRGIDPKGPDAPQSLKEALEKLMGIENGDLSFADQSQISSLADNIGIIATGEKIKPSYSVYDLGEGQSPKNMPDTLLSLVKNNKNEIPFVQGLFNQGAGASLSFCSPEHRFQLVISKQNRFVNSNDDETSDFYGITIIRREKPRKGQRKHFYSYLAPAGQILKFKTDNLPILPTFPNKSGNHFESGTFIKMYEYQNSNKQHNHWINFKASISRELPRIPLPVSFYPCNVKKVERRAIINGLEHRLSMDRYKLIEEGFPLTSSLKIDNEKIGINIYLFKQNTDLRATKDKDAIVYLNNGQVQAKKDKMYLSRKAFKSIHYIKASLYVSVDCSALNQLKKSDLFMANRETLRTTDFSNVLVEKINNLIAKNPLLKEIANKRANEDRKKMIDKNRDFENIFEELLSNDPDLAKVFEFGKLGFNNPFNLGNARIINNYVGLPFPTFFKPRKSFTNESPKRVHIEDSKFRLSLKTDVENAYFVRSNNPGTHELFINGNVVNNYDINLMNGNVSVNVEIPEKLKVEEKMLVELVVNDVSQIQPFKNTWPIIVIAGKSQASKTNSERRKPTEPGNGEDKNKNRLNVPFEYILVSKSGWNDENKFNGEKAMHIKEHDGKYIFFINTDCNHLLHFIKREIGSTDYYMNLFIIGCSMIAWSSIESSKENNENVDHVFNGEQSINGIARLLIPLMRQDKNIKLMSKDLLLAA